MSKKHYMTQKNFDALLAAIAEGGAILRGEQPAARRTILVPLQSNEKAKRRPQGRNSLRSHRT